MSLHQILARLSEDPQLLIFLLFTVVTAVFSTYLFFLLRSIIRMRNLTTLLERLDFSRELTQPIRQATSVRGVIERLGSALTHEFERLRRKLAIQTEATRNLSHDLGGPLTSVLGYTETLIEKNESLTPLDRKNFLEIIHRNTQALRSMVAEFLEISSLEEGLTKIRREKVLIETVMKNVYEQFQPSAQKKNLKFTLQLPLDDNLAVMAEAALLQRAISNLVQNSISYTPEGGKIELCAQGSMGNTCMVYVSDTGEGIAIEHQSQIFEPFFRVNKARSRGAGGMGLGLSIVKRILELHGSAPLVQSTVGQGTTISFTLPRYH